MLRYLSDDSICKVFKYLESDYDYSTISKLRRTNYIISKLAAEHQFNKINAWELRLEKVPKSSNDATLMIDDPDANIPMELVASYSIPNAGFAKIGNTNPLKSSFCVISQIPSTWNEEEANSSVLDESIFVKPAKRWLERRCSRIRDAFEPMKSVQSLTIQRMTFDNKIIMEIKNFEHITRSIESLQITFCKINVTEDELTDFLAMFPKLESLRIEGVFKKGIVTDTHLKSIGGNVHIRNGEDYVTGPVMLFPGITDALCDIWLTQMPTTICFEGVSTIISFSAIMKLLQAFKKVDNEKDDRHYTLGTIYSSKQLQTEIARAQRIRGINWEIRKTSELHDQLFIWPKNHSLSVLLTVDRAGETPDFKSLVAKINIIKMRLDEEEQNIDVEYLHQLTRDVAFIDEELRIHYNTSSTYEHVRTQEQNPQIHMDDDLVHIDQPQVEVHHEADELEVSELDTIFANLNRLEDMIAYLEDIANHLQEQ